MPLLVFLPDLLLTIELNITQATNNHYAEHQPLQVVGALHKHTSIIND